MSSHSLDDDGMDNSHDWNYTSSNFNHRNYSIDNYEDDDDEDESERFGKPMTITIPIENINKLQYESEFKHISLNTRINQIIKDHLDWYSKSHLTKLSYIPKSIVTKAIDQLTEQELSEFAQSAVNDLRDMSLLLRGEFNFSSLLETVNVWLRITRHLTDSMRVKMSTIL
jgi:hypothetical protein